MLSFDVDLAPPVIAGDLGALRRHFYILQHWPLYSIVNQFSCGSFREHRERTSPEAFLYCPCSYVECPVFPRALLAQLGPKIDVLIETRDCTEFKQHAVYPRHGGNAQ